MITIFSPEPTMRALALLPIALGGCCNCMTLRGPPYKVEVLEFRSPCPATCNTLPEHDPEAQWMLMKLPLGGESSDMDTGIVEESFELGWASTSDRIGRDVNCHLQFTLTHRPGEQPEDALGRMLLSRQTGLREWEQLINVAPQSREPVETPGWSIELVGEVPIRPARGEDLTEYLQQDFHIIGAPDEYIEPDPDSCTGDLRSLSFDFRFIPLNPYGE